MKKPLIIQSDNTLLLETAHHEFDIIRDIIAQFSELEKSPEHIHSYRITPLSLWNAASSGLKSADIIKHLVDHSRYEVPDIVKKTISDYMGRFGMLRIETGDSNDLLLKSDDHILINEIFNNLKIKKYLDERINDGSIRINRFFRGHIKQLLIKIGYPVQDLAGYAEGDPCPFKIRTKMLNGADFVIRDYQWDSAHAFYRGGGSDGGSGVIVLPCGGGKTISGIAIMSLYNTKTLILVTNTIALRQWKNELLDKTTLTNEQIGEYSSEHKEIKPITIATYNILTYRKQKHGPFLHFNIFYENNWGLIVYDEVHLLPAPIFRVTSEIQARRRLGLTATLLREDGLQTDVFSLIGPKKYDLPWKSLEKSCWIAAAKCTEVRVEMPDEIRANYSISSDKEKFRLASENPNKSRIVEKLLIFHSEDSVLIIGQYISQLKKIAEYHKMPLITGKTPLSEREALYSQFKEQKIKVLIVSKVANFSIDLPNANVAIQISGTFGSRQEEAQRLGRILRPKKTDNSAKFYTIVSANSIEERFSQKRQLFLTEQGYSYTILEEKSILSQS